MRSHVTPVTSASQWRLGDQRNGQVLGRTTKPIPKGSMPPANTTASVMGGFPTMRQGATLGYGETFGFLARAIMVGAATTDGCNCAKSGIAMLLRFSRRREKMPPMSLIGMGWNRGYEGKTPRRSAPSTRWLFRDAETLGTSAAMYVWRDGLQALASTSAGFDLGPSARRW